MSAESVFKKFPQFELGDVILRELSVEDKIHFFKYMSNANVNKFLSDEDFPKTIVEAEHEILYWSRLFYHKHSIYWAIANKNNKLIGTCGYNNWNRMHKRVEISYDLDYDFWGKGIMTRSIAKICQFAFESLGVIRIQATVAQDNNRSINLLENLHFNQEGLLMKYGSLHGKQKNFYMYSLVPDV